MSLKLALRRFVHQRLGYARTNRNRIECRFDAIRKTAGDVSVILDVGANKGRTTGRFRKEFPSAEIHAFEPHPELFKNLSEVTAAMARAHAHPLAVGNRSGKVSFHLNRFESNHSLLPQAEDGARWARIEHIAEVEVEATSIDDFCRNHGIQAVGLMKVDADGGDLMVLQGADRMLSERRIAAVLVELLYVPIFVGQPYAHDIERFLQAKGYWLFDHYQPQYDATGRIRASNGLFFRNSPAGDGA